MTRTFVRCSDCCAVQAIDGAVPQRLRCTCGGSYTSMGQVRGQRLVQFQSRTPCDDRCTGAVGPKCDCPCGGANHGTGRVVTVTLDAGGVPLIRSPRPEHAAAWRTALAAAHATVRARYGEHVPGQWDAEATYWGRRQMLDAIARATTLKTHGGRMRALAALIPLTPEGSVTP